VFNDIKTQKSISPVSTNHENDTTDIANNEAVNPVTKTVDSPQEPVTDQSTIDASVTDDKHHKPS
jgi:hypothetical protein